MSAADRERPIPAPADRLAEEAAEYVAGRAGPSAAPEVALVLGTGLGDAVRGDLAAVASFGLDELPGFPPPIVAGRPGELLLGSLYGRAAAVFTRRIHYYEGHGMGAATLIPRVAAALGARILVLTNAAGGLDASKGGGRLVLLEDHLNLMGANPLFGWRFPDGMPAFVALHEVYDRALLSLAEEAAARDVGLPVGRGVYAALSGPSFETPAEVRMLARLGADCVGMSTVPEAVAAAALGLRVLGISCVTNVAGADATDDEVRAVAAGAAPALQALLSRVLAKLDEGAGEP